jgi:hypothetical protein
VEHWISITAQNILSQARNFTNCHFSVQNSSHYGQEVPLCCLVLTVHKQFFVEITMPNFLLHSFMVINRMTQKEMSILWEVTLSVIVRKKFISTCM